MVHKDKEKEDVSNPSSQPDSYVLFSLLSDLRTAIVHLQCGVDDIQWSWIYKKNIWWLMFVSHKEKHLWMPNQHPG